MSGGAARTPAVWDLGPAAPHQDGVHERAVVCRRASTLCPHKFLMSLPKASTNFSIAEALFDLSGRSVFYCGRFLDWSPRAADRRRKPPFSQLASACFWEYIWRAERTQTVRKAGEREDRSRTAAQALWHRRRPDSLLEEKGPAAQRQGTDSGRPPVCHRNAFSTHMGRGKFSDSNSTSQPREIIER